MTNKNNANDDLKQKTSITIEEVQEYWPTPKDKPSKKQQSSTNIPKSEVSANVDTASNN